MAHFLTSPFAEALAWTVIHSIWQATVLVLIYKCLVSFQVFKNARQNYNLAFGVLLSQLLLSIATFWLVFEPLRIDLIMNSNLMPMFDLTATYGQSIEAQNIFEQIQISLFPFLPAVVCIWVIGIFFLLIRLLMGYSFWYHLKRKNLIELPEDWMQLFHRMQTRMDIHQKVNIAMTRNISSPLLIGHVKPIILLPFALMNQLTIEQVEVILAHELAHIQRHDFALNIIQILIETIYYYHPAIWWLGKQIRSIREECADDMTLMHTDNSVVYAQALLTVAEQSRNHQLVLGMGLLGQNKKHLLTRIQRILHQPVKQPDMREKFAITGLLLFLAIAVSLGAAWSSPSSNGYYGNNNLVLIDTLPMGQIHIETEENGETLNVSLNDGKIEKLNVNGKDIPPSEFATYEDKVTEILENIPPPPPPVPQTPDVLAPMDEMAPPPPPSHGRKTHIVTRTTKSIDEDGNVIEEVSIEEEIGDVKVQYEIREAQMAEGRLQEAERELEHAERELQMAKRATEREAAMEERRVETEERMEERLERNKDRIEREEERVERLAEEHGNKDKWLEEELLGDGLITNANNYSIRLNNKRMKVNGNKVSPEVHAKYLELYKESRGTDAVNNNNTAINISKKMF